jgi:hypothetical protein
LQTKETEMNALDPIMPNGKALSECTFDEVGEWGKRQAVISQVADNVGAKTLGELPAGTLSADDLTLIRSSLQLGLRAQTKPNGAGVTDEIEHQFLDTKDGEMSK